MSLYIYVHELSGVEEVWSMVLQGLPQALPALAHAHLQAHGGGGAAAAAAGYTGTTRTSGRRRRRRRRTAGQTAKSEYDLDV